MSFDADRLLAASRRGESIRYTDRDTLLYALSVGFGTDEAELPFVWEGAGLQAVPTFATVLSRPGLLAGSGMDFSRMLLAGVRLHLHRPMPPDAELVADSHVSGLFDRGEARGAVVVMDTFARTATDGAPLFLMQTMLAARGDGGFGGPAPPADLWRPLPGRPPDRTAGFPTRPDAALLFRLHGDRNPLHADPARARRIGFDQPIMHGLCTLGIACRAVLRDVCGYRASRILGVQGRLTAAAYPGETIVTEIWMDGPAVSFRCRLAEREITVVDNGRVDLTPS